MIRLYTESQLKDARRIDVATGRLDAVVDACTALYMSLDSLETERNLDSVTGAKRSIREAMSKMSDDVRNLLRSESERILDSTVEFPEVGDIEDRIRELEDDLEERRDAR